MAWRFFNNQGAQKVGTSTSAYGTALPSSPYDGQQFVLVDSLTLPTYQWLFRYNAGSSNTDKWEFVGGPPVIRDQGGTPGSQTPGTAFVDISAGNSLSFTVPRAGVYRVHFGGNPSPPAGQVANMALKKGTAAAVDADGHNPTLIGNQFTGYRELEAAGLAASDTLKLQIRTTAAGQAVTYFTASMSIFPVRVS